MQGKPTELDLCCVIHRICVASLLGYNLHTIPNHGWYELSCCF